MWKHLTPALTWWWRWYLMTWLLMCPPAASQDAFTPLCKPPAVKSQADLPANQHGHYSYLHAYSLGRNGNRNNLRIWENLQSKFNLKIQWRILINQECEGNCHFFPELITLTSNGSIEESLSDDLIISLIQLCKGPEEPCDQRRL